MSSAPRRSEPAVLPEAWPDRPEDVAFRPAVEEPAATVFACPLCGGKFTHGGLVCGSCPLNAGCDIVKCPHCGYQYPRSSRIVDWLRRRFGRRSPAAR